MSSNPETQAILRGWFVRAVLIVIICEKVIQHLTVTLALWLNRGDIRATVAADPTVLMILGAIVAALFLVALWGVLRNHRWTPGLLIALALFDIIGECAAQGTLAIAINVSFIVAIVLLYFAIRYRRQLRNPGL